MSNEPDFTTEPGICGGNRWKVHPFPDPDPAEVAPTSKEEAAAPAKKRANPKEAS